ncbi:D-alanyl-D-alanine carboxypeptidase/D-alanyl-D-alanine endopeptidase [Plantactinospora sp. CA-290183]|uniref:D-alanyl-D-alanine carboxypeptidase/D-alanyl-D-alanine endopeptidase n=1 Tax=Plantactinospora sp. CA-290183 TaxID=3240006 RepID=UPI003D9081D5
MPAPGHPAPAAPASGHPAPAAPPAYPNPAASPGQQGPASTPGQQGPAGAPPPYPNPAAPPAHARAWPTNPPVVPAGGPPPAAQPPAQPPPAEDPPVGRRRRRTLIVALAAVLVLGLAAAGVVVVRPGPVDGWLGGDRAATQAGPDLAEPPPPPVLTAAGNSAPAPTPDGVRAALAPLLSSSVLGDDVNISVVDAVSDQPLFERGQDKPLVPASTTKLVTAVTVLAARGPAHRIATRVVAGENPGEVVVIGAGDPTLAVDETGWYPGAGRLDRLATQVKKALGGTAPTKVTVDGSLFPGPNVGPGWDSDAHTGGFGAVITALMVDGARLDPKDQGRGQARSQNPDLAAGRAFAGKLGLPGSAVSRGSAPAGSATAPVAATSASPSATAAPGTELGRVESPPMIRLVEFMLRESDNVVGEALARQVALARGKPGSFDGAGEAMDAVVAELGLPEAQTALSDGSGLSRRNRITPGLLTELLSRAADGSRPELAGVFPGLPVAAWSGTLEDRFGPSGGASPGTATGSGAGVVRAKTGTLSGVHAISGVVTTAEGRLLAFAVLANGVPGGPDQAQPALDRIADALAACGCR